MEMMPVSDHGGTSLKKLNATSLAKGHSDLELSTRHVPSWCRNWSAANYYLQEPNQNPIGPKNNQYYVVQGGSWYRSRRSSVRVRLAARFRHFVVCYTFGFRLVREL